MAIDIIYANADDFWITSHDTTWSGARSGPGSGASGSAQIGTGSILFGTNYAFVGTDFDEFGNPIDGYWQYNCYETLLHFDTSAVTGTETSSSLNLSISTTLGSPSIECAESSWSSASTSSFVAGSSLGSLTRFRTTASTVSSTGVLSIVRNNGTTPASSSYGLILYGEKQRTDTAPTGNDYAIAHSSEASGTTNDPYLSITSITAKPRSFGIIIA